MRFVSTGFRIRTVGLAISIGLLAIAGGICAAHAAATYSVLYRFPGGTGGISPAGPLVRDSSGALYGTTSYGGYGFGFGTVFKLTPPAAGETAWTETVIYRFKGSDSDGDTPHGALMIDGAGSLYGTTYYGGKGNTGTVFKLTPPAADKKAWTETVLYMFQPSNVPGSPFTAFVDAAYPVAGVILVNGSLYGTASYGGLNDERYGAVYELTPPPAGSKQRTWTETVIHSFRGGSDGEYPVAELVADAAGALYGTTENGGAKGCDFGAAHGCGTVFKLVPPAAGKKAWTESVLHRFAGKGEAIMPQAPLTFGANGVLYGTAGGDENGAVFSLTPPAKGKTVWTKTVLHNFTGADGQYPLGSVAIGSDGSLYGTTREGGTAGLGTVFALKPPASSGKNWTATVLHSFTGVHEGLFPSSGLIQDKNGHLFGTSYDDEASNGDGSTHYGTVFKLTP
jgi:uncharacterized repeat protein (TIGR03803 family)